MLKRILFTTFTLLGTSLPIFAQLVVSGTLNDPLQPELYIEDGANSFVYVQGDVVANSGTTPGLTPHIVVNGGLFVDQDFGTATPGDIKNQLTGADLRFDRQAGATITGSLPSISNAGVGGTVHLMADGTQEIESPDGQSVHFYNVNLANDNAGGGASVQDRTIVNTATAGTLKVTVGATRASSASGSGRLLLSDDRLNTNDHLVEVRNNSIAAIERDAAGSAAFATPGMDPDNQAPDNDKGMVTSTENGRLGRLINGGQSYLFPVGMAPGSSVTVPVVNPIGTMPLYRPALTQGGTAGEIYYVAILPNTPNTGSMITNLPGALNTLYYWRINTSGASSPTSLRLFGTYTDMTATYDFSGCAGTLVDSLIANLSVAQAENANITGWQDQAGTGSHAPLAGFMPFGESSSYSSILQPFAPLSTVTNEDVGFTLSRVPLSTTPFYSVGCDPFPLHGIELTAVGKFGKFIDLDWTTILEHNGDKFEMERSTDNANFTRVIGLDKQANGTPSTYGTEDHAVLPNTRYYYRVKRVSIDGASEYSNVASAILENTKSVIGGVYPNPTNGDININIYANGERDYRFRMFNAIGQAVFNKEVTALPGENVINLNLTKLAIGTYQLVVTDLETGQISGVVKILRY
ncbi:MAG: T9SS type A sorting domain-containing protein [Bacteroidia bacterium]